MKLKKNDSLRKKLKAVANAMRRREEPEEAERYRKKKRGNVSSAWKERKQRRQFSQKLTTPVKRKLKNLEQKLRRKYMKFSEQKSSKKGASSSQVTPQNSKLIVSKAIWNHMSPKSKYKVVRSLKVSPEIRKGLNCAIRIEIWG